MTTPILELRQISKTFGTKSANRDISLVFEPGRIHAIVGENGAGKTTLMNMIAGNLEPTSGQILFDGSPVEITDPTTANTLGIGMVHQHFKLVPSLTVAANVFLGRERSNVFGRLDQAAMEQRVAELSATFGLQINPRDRVRDLSVGERQRVEILKALSHDTRVLILDEPTAVLTPAETADMFAVVRILAERGCAVVFISHKLGEVLSIADVVTVIRDGSVIGTRPADGLQESDIASMMVGRDVLLNIAHTPAEPGAEVLSVDGVFAVDQRGAIAVRDLSLTVRAGEIVGIAGVEGNGQTELASSVAGLYVPQRGRVRLDGEDVTTASVARRRARGLAYIPEDRFEEGAGPGLSISENIAATHLTAPIARRGWLSIRSMRAYAEHLIKKFDVRGAEPETPIGSLSGGNAQKVIIAREFESQPKLLVVSQPTRGVDVGAMEFVHRAIIQARNEGAGVLLLSADLNEVMSLSDRLLVMYRGEFVAEFSHDDMDEVAVGLAMAGIAPPPRPRLEDDNHHRPEPGGAGRRTEPDEARSAPLTAVQSEELTTLPSNGPHRGASARSRRRLSRERVLDAARSAAQPIAAVLIALVIGAALILAIGQNPVTAYIQLFTSGWGTPYGIGSIVAVFIPLAIMSAGTIISFRAGFFSIAGEGSLYFGAFFGAWFGFTFKGLPPVLAIVLILIVGAVAGALWSFIPAVLFAIWRADIVVTTLLLSTVATLVTNYFVTGPFQDKTAGAPASPKIDDAYNLPLFNPSYGIGPDLLIAIAAAVALGLLLNRTPWGLKVKQLGELNRFAEYSGVSIRKMSIQVLMVSGAAAGLAGALYVIGPNGGRFIQQFSPGFGFLAITVALLARLNPWGSLVAALFYATMMAGSTGLQTVGVPFPTVNVLQGLIIITITATFLISRARRRKDPSAPIREPERPVNSQGAIR